MRKSIVTMKYKEDTKCAIYHHRIFVSSLYFMVAKERKGRLRPPSEPPARGPVPLTPSCETFYHAFLRGYEFFTARKFLRPGTFLSTLCLKHIK